MEDSLENMDLVKQAQAGNEKSRERLVENIHEHLRTYIYRRTSDYNLTEDILQESLLEMLKILGDLKDAERFWPWLCKIALNKIRRYYRTENRRRELLFTKMGNGDDMKMSEHKLAELVTEELKQAVLASMQQLKLSHREILTLRCYENKTYSQVARELGCSELSARVSFYRAKKQLQKQLTRRGLGKGALLTALVIFGKLTGTTKAAAGMTIAPAQLEIGITAGLIGTLTSKLAISVVSLVAIVTGSFYTAVAITNHYASGHTFSPGFSNERFEPGNQLSGQEEYWFFYPEGTRGAVLLRHVTQNADDAASYCQWLQNDNANYYYNIKKNTVYINNYHAWDPGLSVMHLPTDSQELCNFIGQVQGNPCNCRHVTGSGGGALIIVRSDGYECKDIQHIPGHYNVLNEEYSRYNWPLDTTLVDQRDPLHRRGYGHFLVTGTLDNRRVSGEGQIPFVYKYHREKPAWLKLTIEGLGQIEDGPDSSFVYDLKQDRTSKYSSGFFWKGLMRPWSGLHTLDTIRRDAAELRMHFETRYSPGDVYAYVTINDKSVKDARKLIYTINMQRDLVETIEFQSVVDGVTTPSGQLKFTYYLPEELTISSYFNLASNRDIRAGDTMRSGLLWHHAFSEEK